MGNKENTVATEEAQRLWEREPSLWEAAQSETFSEPVPACNPQSRYAGAKYVNLDTPRLMARLWGPPERLTISLGKTDVWDRRRYFEPSLTLAQIKERIAKGDVPKHYPGFHYISWSAYDFPCSKPVGQIILFCPDLEGAAQPVAVSRLRDNTKTVEIEKGEARARLTYMAMMPRDLVVINAQLQGIRGEVAARLYRHQDINGWNTSVFASIRGDGTAEHVPGTLGDYDYEKDTDPDHGPFEAPGSGCDGDIFWIRQRFPAEKTFPEGFEYVMAATVLESEATIETAEGRTGLGTPPRMGQDELEILARGGRLHRRFVRGYKPIREAPGAAATAHLPRQTDLNFTLVVSIVTSTSELDPLAEAKRRLSVAGRKGFAGLVAENDAWYRALYDRREKGRIFHGSTDFAKTQAAEAFRSWTFAHQGVCDPDPIRFEMARTYTLLEQDYDFFHGMPCYDELFHTFVHVRNRSERLSYYYRLYNFWLSACMKNAREVFGLPGAALLLGYLPPIIPDEYAHSSGTWEFCMEIPAEVMKCLWDCFDYGGDELFLSETVYPALRQTAIFYANYAALGDDGKYHVIPTLSAEYWGWTANFEKNRDSTSALCMFKWLLDRAAQASEILGCDADLRDRWREIADNMAPYPTWDTPEGPIFTDVLGQNPIGVDYRTVFAAVYPCTLADEINLDSPEEQKEAMLRTMRYVKWSERGWGSSDVRFLIGAEKGVPPEEFVVTPVGCAPRTNIAGKLFTPEHLINSRSGRIHLFPAVPDDATAAFRDMQARGGFEVSAEIIKGKVTYVCLLSRRDIACRIMNPWTGRRIRVCEESSGKEVQHQVDTMQGECVVFRAEKGKAYTLVPVSS